MINTSKLTVYLILVFVFVVSACQETSTNSVTEPEESIMAMEMNSMNSSQSENASGLDIESLVNIHEINQQLASQGANVRLAFAETVTFGVGSAEPMGQTIFANDRQQRLDAQWVANDARRNADGDNITHVIDGSFAFANVFNLNPPINGEPAIDASFDTWNSLKKNAKMNVVKVPDNGATNYSVLLGTGDPVADALYADISTIGFLPGAVFDAVLGAGSSTNVLGVTFTYVWLDGAGNPSDVNNDGYNDVALKEVWYNDDFLWTTDSNGAGVDIETVALHENGHALGLGHFGKIFGTNKNGKLHVATRAVMNAVILGTQRELLGTDKSSYNSIYGSWPK